jgi:hypothetical protein
MAIRRYIIPGERLKIRELRADLNGSRPYFNITPNIKWQPIFSLHIKNETDIKKTVFYSLQSEAKLDYIYFNRVLGILI